MNVALVDIDSHNFPNLVLMKLAAWHIRQGDNVELVQPSDILLGDNLFAPYDKVYGACVFTQNAKLAEKIEEVGGYVAGSGTGKPDVLPDDIEHIYPYYPLYGITDTAYGFLTRGCPRKCPFCIVSEKEGTRSRKSVITDLSEWWNGQKNIKLLDPNILACKEHEELLEQLAESGAWVDFTQGVDVRLLTERNMKIINRIKTKRIHFAWDNPKDETVKKKLLFFSEASRVKDYRRKCVYVLTNYWSSHEEDLGRVYWLRDNGFDPYVMIYNKENAPEETRYLQRWVNNKKIFRTITRFEEYDHTRG